MLVLAPASCTAGSCPGVWLDPENGDVYVVGDRLDQKSAREDASCYLTVRLPLAICEAAMRVLATGAGLPEGRAADEIPVRVEADSALVRGRVVTPPPAGIVVADHEAAVLVRRLAPALVRALAETVRG